ncbi:hypothetical protein DIE06_36320 [Burkholderia sp. Bp8998]|nr:hypothetical protein DIE06_36320 [Burkholderia sp. Bp8998]
MRSRYRDPVTGSLCDECLNVHWFETLGEAKAIVEAWQRDYNESRSHCSQGVGASRIRPSAGGFIGFY